MPICVTRRNYARLRRQHPFKKNGCYVALNSRAAPWFSNPLKPDWLVCKLTHLGRVIAGEKKSPSDY
jgi:hypothetical protein